MDPLINLAQFLVNVIIKLYIFILMIRVLLQWFNINYNNPLCQAVGRFTRIPLIPFNKIIPQVKGIDVPAIILIICLQVIKIVITKTLLGAFPSNIAGVFILATGSLLREVLNIYFYILIARIILSWIPLLQLTMLAYLIYRITEPLLSYIRRFVSPIGGMDLSPIIAMIILGAISIVLVAPIVQLGVKLVFA